MKDVLATSELVGGLDSPQLRDGLAYLQVGADSTQYQYVLIRLVHMLIQHLGLFKEYSLLLLELHTTPRPF